MERNYFTDYAWITGETNFGIYKTPEEEANNIEKCTILKRVNVTYSHNILDNNSNITRV